MNSTSWKKKHTATGVDTTPHYSESEVNTERVVLKNTSMQHVEGGWPKDVDYTEQTDVKRYRKKVEKDEEFQFAMKTLVPRPSPTLYETKQHCQHLRGILSRRQRH